MSTTALEGRVLEALDVDAMIEAVRRLVRIPSANGHETPAQEAVAELLADGGLAVDVWEIDLAEVQSHPDASWEIERDRALGVVGSLEGAGGGRTLILNGHVDVVPAGRPELWSRAPFGGAVEGGHVHGRGALDMKGPLMAGLFALRALRAADAHLAGTVRLQSVIGEEDGGLGTLAAILRGYRGDGAVVMEPTDLAVVPLQAGCQNFRVQVPGRAAHGAVREEGVNAFDKLYVVYDALRRLETVRNEATPDPLFARYAIPFPLNVGIVSGGSWASSVPDMAVMEGRYGIRPDEDPLEARRELEAAVAEAARGDPFLRDHPPVVEWWGGRFLPAATEPEHPLVEAVQAAHESATGRTAALEGVPFGADAGLLRRVADTPTVLYGAGDIRQAHRPDECVAIDALELMARTLALTAIRFCGVSRESGAGA